MYFCSSTQLTNEKKNLKHDQIFRFLEVSETKTIIVNVVTMMMLNLITIGRLLSVR